MAVYEIRSEEKEASSVTVERIEVRPWRLGGTSHQDFVIGSGANFNATGNILIEIIYSVNDVQFFYSRNFIHDVEYESPIAEKLKGLEKFESGEYDGYGFGDMLPETSIIIKRNKHTYTDGNNQPQSYVQYSLNISADTGALIGKSGPGVRAIEIKIDLDEAEGGIDFMRQLTKEIDQVQQGKHPDPADIPSGSSDWTFARLVNQKAYDKIALDYVEHYFSEARLTETFDAWLTDLAAGAHILDVGCGHGKPVITRLLEKGCRVTGTDLSPKMLERARENFPNVPFINSMANELAQEAEFDGACSLSSLLYLDPIDLSHSLYRLHHALRPDSLLFLHAYELHPSWRGEPYHRAMNEWMWGWTYGLDEAVQILEEHGYFKVLSAQDVTSEEEKQAKIEKWRAYKQAEYESSLEHYPNLQFQRPDLNKPPILAYKYVIVAQRQDR
jgi:SAM-dependent methyltransferase